MRLRANLFCVLDLDHLKSELQWESESAYEQLADNLLSSPLHNDFIPVNFSCSHFRKPKIILSDVTYWPSQEAETLMYQCDFCKQVCMQRDGHKIPSFLALFSKCFLVMCSLSQTSVCFHLVQSLKTSVGFRAPNCVCISNLGHDSNTHTHTYAYAQIYIQRDK